MRNIQILDCTLRDGGRVIDCAFDDKEIYDICLKLSDAYIDIVEVGFLRDSRKVNYMGNSTFFTNINQISPFISNCNKRTMYVAFVDYGMFDLNTLSPYDGTSIEGIRIGFNKSDYETNKYNIKKILLKIKELGYKLFVQGINTPGYSDKEILELLDLVNEVEPYSFGIVDTYGSMYADDLKRYYDLIDRNLKRSVNIDFHSHNNFQLSFSLAQELIRLCNGKRNIIIDATLNGMGKCAGNLNTELIVDYLVRKCEYPYDFDTILDIIDDNMYNYKKNYGWGYSIPAVMAGVYKAHPNNIIYLTEKYRLANKEIKYIIQMIEPEKRQRYDYNNIQRLYLEYNSSRVDDKKAIKAIQDKVNNRTILILMPGQTLLKYKERINTIISEYDPIIFSINFVSQLGDRENRIAFFGSGKRYAKNYIQRENEQVIVVSNINSDTQSDLRINYESLVERDDENFDNTTIMLLNLLKKLTVYQLMFAGFDGYQKNSNNYFDDKVFEEGRFEKNYESINKSVGEAVKRYIEQVCNDKKIIFVTPSIYNKDN